MDEQTGERVLAKTELNLERWPVFLTEKRSGVMEQQWTDGERLWRCFTKDPQGLPGPFGADLWVALSKLWNDQRGRPENDTLRTTLGEFVTVLGLSRGGNTYQQIATTLVRFMSVHFSCKGTFRRKDGTFARVQHFQLLSSVAFESRTDAPGVVGDTEVPLKLSQDTIIEVRFAPEIAQSIHDKVFRLLDVVTYRALAGSTARRLYRYLDQRRYASGTGMQDVLDVPLRELKERLPMITDQANGMRRTLQNAHTELIEIGVLHSAEYVKLAGRGVDAWVVRYTFRSATLALPAPAVTAPRPSELVAEMLAVLKDEASAKWYGKIAMRLPADAIRNVLGGIKQELEGPNSFGLPVLRKAFTTRIKQRAAAMQISLD